MHRGRVRDIGGWTAGVNDERGEKGRPGDEAAAVAAAA